MASTVYSSVYNIHEDWLKNIAPKYFEMEDISILKSSMFGYINEIMANSLEDTAYSMSLMYNEIFPNRAVLPKSLCSYSALAKFDDFNYFPSKMGFYLYLRKNDILKQATDVGVDSKVFKIDKFSQVFISEKEDTPFILPYTMNISLNRALVKGIYQWVTTAYYDETIPNPFANNKTPYLPITEVLYEDEPYLLIPFYGFNLQKTTTKFTVYKTDLVENILFNLEYEGNLAYFEVFYKPNNSEDIYYVNKYFVDSYGAYDEKFCFYEYVGENKIEISFSALPRYFKPEYNSQVIVNVYTTQGASGNFQYTGTGLSFRFNTDLDFGSTELDPSKIRYFITNFTDATDGLDGLNMNELRSRISEEFSKRDNIITEKDLELEFKKLESTGTVKFYKKRDDVIKRVYNAFVMLNSPDLGIVPANTVDLIAFDDDFTVHTQNNCMILKPGTKLKVYDKALNYYREDHDTYTEAQLIDLDNDPDVFTYGIPYLIRVKRKPLMLTYYMTSMFKSIPLKCSYINEKIAASFIISDFRIVRNSMESDDYEITVDLVTAVSPDSFFNYITSDGYIQDENSNLKLVGYILNGKSLEASYDLKPYRVNSASNIIQFKAYFHTSDVISDNDYLEINNCTRVLSGTDDIVMSKFQFKPSIQNMSFGIFYNRGVSVGNEDHGLLYGTRSDLYDFSLASYYETTDYVNLIQNMNDITDSSIITKVDPRATHTNYFLIRQVPVIRYLYLHSEVYLQEFINLLLRCKENYNSIVNILHNHYSLDLKFINTYGKSNNFTIGYGSETKLNRIALSIGFLIRVNGDITEELNTAIRNEISNFIVETNTSSVSALYVSDIMNRLRNKFSQIIMIEFKGFNNYPVDYQSITLTEEDYGNQNIMQKSRFVPEYLNVFSKFVKDSSGDSYFVPDISIDFVQ